MKMHLEAVYKAHFILWHFIIKIKIFIVSIVLTTYNKDDKILYIETCIIKVWVVNSTQIINCTQSTSKDMLNQRILGTKLAKKFKWSKDNFENIVWQN